MQAILLRSQLVSADAFSRYTRRSSLFACSCVEPIAYSVLDCVSWTTRPEPTRAQAQTLPLGVAMVQRTDTGDKPTRVSHVQCSCDIEILLAALIKIQRRAKAGVPTLPTTSHTLMTGIVVIP
jgi:hypothetical protein